MRFAPSPTGALHIGGVRTALFNYLFAKKHGGTFILRIEDTDENRFVPWAEKYIVDALEWLGIQADEGPVNGGEFAPYRQSERKDIYSEYAMKLVEEGKAYYAFDTAEELNVLREKLKAAKASSLNYNAVSRVQMKNSLTLSDDDVQNRIDSGEPYVIRINIPLKEEIRFQDQVRGWVVVQSSTLDDKVLLKSDGMPTYHLANIVDDHLMGITHVIRGEEWLPSAPLHVILYNYFEWTAPMFAHLPLLLKPDGNGKLSKRDAEKHGFPIFPLQWLDGDKKVQGFRESGYYPEAVLNFIALLGWNPGGEQEIFGMKELIDLFTIEKVHKSGAKFDIQKANWFNEHYLGVKDEKSIARQLVADVEDKGLTIDDDVSVELVQLLKDRVTFESELLPLAKFYFEEPISYDDDLVSKKWTAQAVNVLAEFASRVESYENGSIDDFKSILMNVLDKQDVKMGKVMPALRLSITGETTGPDLMGMIKILGGHRVSQRILKAINSLADRVID